MVPGCWPFGGDGTKSLNSSQIIWTWTLETRRVDFDPVIIFKYQRFWIRLWLLDLQYSELPYVGGVHWDDNVLSRTRFSIGSMIIPNYMKVEMRFLAVNHNNTRKELIRTTGGQSSNWTTDQLKARGSEGPAHRRRLWRTSSMCWCWLCLCWLEIWWNQRLKPT